MKDSPIYEACTSLLLSHICSSKGVWSTWPVTHAFRASTGCGAAELIDSATGRGWQELLAGLETLCLNWLLKLISTASLCDASFFRTTGSRLSSCFSSAKLAVWVLRRIHYLELGSTGKVGRLWRWLISAQKWSPHMKLDFGLYSTPFHLAKQASESVTRVHLLIKRRRALFAATQLAENSEKYAGKTYVTSKCPYSILTPWMHLPHSAASASAATFFDCFSAKPVSRRISSIKTYSWYASDAVLFITLYSI